MAFCVTDLLVVAALSAAPSGWTTLVSAGDDAHVTAVGASDHPCEPVPRGTDAPTSPTASISAELRVAERSCSRPPFVAAGNIGPGELHASLVERPPIAWFVIS